MATSAAAITGYAHIVKEEGYCGGKATIGNTRVRVNNVALLHKHDKTVDEILTDYPDLSRAQVHAAIAYYYDHPEEIEAEWAREEKAYEEGLRQQAERERRRAAG